MQEKMRTGISTFASSIILVIVLGMMFFGTSFAGGASGDGKLKFKSHKHCHKHGHLHGYGKSKTTHRHRHCHKHWHPYKNSGHSHKNHRAEFHSKKILFKNHHKGHIAKKTKKSSKKKN